MAIRAIDMQPGARALSQWLPRIVRIGQAQQLCRRILNSQDTEFFQAGKLGRFAARVQLQPIEGKSLTRPYVMTAQTFGPAMKPPWDLTPPARSRRVLDREDIV